MSRAKPRTSARLDASPDGLGYRVARRTLDIVASLGVLVVTFPLMAAIAVTIKLDSPGPVLFKHRRIGINRRRGASGASHNDERRTEDLYGDPFTLYKFRTMFSDAKDRFPDLYAYHYSPEELNSMPIKALVSQKRSVRGDDGTLQVHDPRVTRVGRWLRRTSLDELPNFINVLKGDMHLVGPRADIVENIRYYPEHHRAKLEVRPGVTGLAQVNGRGWLSFLETNEHDLEYVEHRSFALDLKIIWKTIVVTLQRDGAC
jgi:lipopolysaccharide/colanic/teichoic acid biosynthesis glycosyltransferase